MPGSRETPVSAAGKACFKPSVNLPRKTSLSTYFGQEETGAAGDAPSGWRSGEASGRHHAMEMRMMASALTIP